MVLNIRTLPFHKSFVRFGQSLPQQFIHNITADALNSGDNVLCRRLRTLAALTETDTTETCGGTQSQYVFQLFAHAGKPCCHTAAQLAHGSKLPFVIRQIPNAHRLIDQKHQRSRGVHELMNAQHRSSTIATLQHARQIVLPRLSHHA